MSNALALQVGITRNKTNCGRCLRVRPQNVDYNAL